MAIDGLISVDDHLIEPPDTWEKRLPSRYRDLGPKLVRGERGDLWEYAGKRFDVQGMISAAGVPDEELSWHMHYEDMRPESYDPVARLKDMDTDHVLAAACFPSFPGFSGTFLSAAEDKELARLSVEAYNDFVLDEWCGAAPGRYIPLVLVPLWDPAAAVAEVHRTVAKGAKAVAFSENPAKQGYPSIHDAGRHWDPLFAAVQEAGMPLCMHIGSSSHMPPTSRDAPATVHFTISLINAQYGLADWLLSGVFDRFPTLKIAFSEGGIGWIPWLVERAEYVWNRHHNWTDAPSKLPPSAYIADHVYGCFIDDPFGAKNIDKIGVRNVMVESDYPHTDSAWPNTLKSLLGQISHLDEDSQSLVLRGNAERLFNFTPSGIGQR